MKYYAPRLDADGNDQHPREKHKHENQPAPRLLAENSRSENDSESDETNEDMQYSVTILSALTVDSKLAAYWHHNCSEDENILITKNSLLFKGNTHQKTFPFWHVSPVPVLLYQLRARNRRIISLMLVTPWRRSETCSNWSNQTTSYFCSPCYPQPSDLFHCSKVLEE